MGQIWNFVMKTIEFKTFLVGAIICTLAFTSTLAADVTPAEARVIARDAYIFAYPLAMQYHTMYVQAIDSNSKEYVGGFGKYRHYGISTPDNKDIVTPNNDTPYSWAHVDLRAEPWVLSLPQTDGRYFTTQWMDLWHFIVDNPGSVLDGSEGGNFLLAAPGWKGEVPKGIKRIVRGESDFMGTLTRTQLKGIDDLPAMQKTQQGYKLQPLSAFLGQKPSAPAPEIEWPMWTEKVDRTADIFRYVNFMLPYTTPNVLDRPILERIAKIGIGPGKPWNLAEMKPEIRRAIEEGVAARCARSSAGLQQEQIHHYLPAWAVAQLPFLLVHHYVWIAGTFAGPESHPTLLHRQQFTRSEDCGGWVDGDLPPEGFPRSGQAGQLAARTRLGVFSSLAGVWAGRSRTGRQMESARTRTREMICSTLPPKA